MPLSVEETVALIRGSLEHGMYELEIARMHALVVLIADIGLRIKTEALALDRVDVESSFNEPKPPKESPPTPPSKSGGKLGLPGSIVQGGGADVDDPPPSESPPPPPLDNAIDEQADLLAEFAKIADELQKILGELENSTFVKRLKAASRRQMEGR